MTRNPLPGAPLAAVLAAVSAAVLAACAAEEMPGPEEGAAIYAENCTACHGYRGEGGDLIGGRNAPYLTRIAARNDGTFPRARVLSQIDGYHRGQVPGAVMPEYGVLLEGDLVPVEVDGVMTPTPRPLAAILAHLESIQVP